MRPISGSVLKVLTTLSEPTKVDTEELCTILGMTGVGDVSGVRFLDAQWQMLNRFGLLTPELDANMTIATDFAWPEFLQGVASSVVSLRNKMASRGAQLMGVLLASHKLSMEEAYVAFLGGREHITFDRFREIMRRLAPGFGDASPRIEALFLSLAAPNQTHVCKEKLVEVLKKTAGRLSNKHLERFLLSNSSPASKSEVPSADPQESDKDALDGGDRQRLRDVFFDSKSDEHVAGADDKAYRLEQNKMFINSKQLRLSLSKMGVFVKKDALEAEQGQIIALNPTSYTPHPTLGL